MLFLWNMEWWFANPLSLTQILSWSFLIFSLYLIAAGVSAFRKYGKIDHRREDNSLVGIEKTSTLVTVGIYHYIRHPFYSSLLFLGWGIFFKNPIWPGVVLTFINVGLLLVTARKEEVENTSYFGDAYRLYMNETKRFIPFVY